MNIHRKAAESAEFVFIMFSDETPENIIIITCPESKN